MAWTPTQQIVLAMAPKVSSVFSLFGSTWIVVEVLTHNKGKNPKRRQPYHRLLLAMSIYDILESIWNFASTWPIPLETEDVHSPVGTTATCTAQGFFLTLGIAVPIYNAFLSLYYLLVIRYRYTEATLKQRVEPTMHTVSFVFAFGTAATSSFMGLINNANLWCWIAPYPGDCLDSRRYPDDADCERGDNAWIYRWAFYFAPLWFCILFATVCTLMVYQYVLSIEHRTVRYRRPQNALRASLERLGWTKRKESRDGETGEETPAGTQLGGAGYSISESRPRTRLTKRAKDYRQTVEVFRQSLWYLGSFYITHVWSTSNRIIQQLSNGKTFFAVIALHSWFDPLQGFLNFVIYQRPRYFKVRKDNPEKGRLAAIGIVLRFSFLTEIDAAIRTSGTPTPTRSQDTGKSGADSFCSGKVDPAVETASEVDCNGSEISEDISATSAECYLMFSSQARDEGSKTEKRVLPPVHPMELSSSDVDSLDWAPSSDESGYQSSASGSEELPVLHAQGSSRAVPADDEFGGHGVERAPNDLSEKSVASIATTSSDESQPSAAEESTYPPLGSDIQTAQAHANKGDYHASAVPERLPDPEVSFSSDWYFRFI